jgi:hypothetical protein
MRLWYYNLRKVHNCVFMDAHSLHIIVAFCTTRWGFVHAPIEKDTASSDDAAVAAGAVSVKEAVAQGTCPPRLFHLKRCTNTALKAIAGRNLAQCVQLSLLVALLLQLAVGSALH